MYILSCLNQSEKSFISSVMALSLCFCLSIQCDSTHSNSEIKSDMHSRASKCDIFSIFRQGNLHFCNETTVNVKFWYTIKLRCVNALQSNFLVNKSLKKSNLNFQTSINQFIIFLQLHVFQLRLIKSIIESMSSCIQKMVIQLY